MRELLEVCPGIQVRFLCLQRYIVGDLHVQLLYLCLQLREVPVTGGRTDIIVGLIADQVRVLHCMSNGEVGGSTLGGI